MFGGTVPIPAEYLWVLTLLPDECLDHLDGTRVFPDHLAQVRFPCDAVSS